MGCLNCCGSFCLVLSIVCALMQFVFYGLIASNNERIEIGHNSHEREAYKDTSLYTAIVYCVLRLSSNLYTVSVFLCTCQMTDCCLWNRFIIISVGCIFGGQKKGQHSFEQGYHDEHSSLVQNVGAPDDEQNNSGLIN